MISKAISEPGLLEDYKTLLQNCNDDKYEDEIHGYRLIYELRWYVPNINLKLRKRLCCD